MRRNKHQEIVCDLEEILKNSIFLLPHKDVVAWNFELPGSFSVKSHTGE
jgi:hypothetical protein